MKILVVGGTRLMGRHLVQELLGRGHAVTIATRGRTPDGFDSGVSRLVLERTSPESIQTALGRKHFDVICDSLAYSSNDVKYLLDVADCRRYVMISTASVYNDLHMDTAEDEYDPLRQPLKWCSRGDFPYGEIKRQAENALFQCYAGQEAVAIRFPYVIGMDDYTHRLHFYLEHIEKGIPMFIDSADAQTSFIRSDEAGRFIAFMAESGFRGCINGSSHGAVPIMDIVAYLEKKTGKQAVLSSEGEAAPYNGGQSFSLNVDRGEKLGFKFSNLHEWIFDLLDQMIAAYRPSVPE
jgi:nucleoside-diphosphate-sugar epimerase